MTALTATAGGVLIALHVQPRASRTELAGEHDGRLKLRIAAPPVDGAANQEIVAWLSKQLKVPKREISIVSGERGRSKTVRVNGPGVGEVRSLLGLA